MVRKHKQKKAGSANSGSKNVLDVGLKLFLVVLLLTIVVYFFGPASKYKGEWVNSTPFPSINPSVTPQPTQMLNQLEWETYESKEFGFSVKYPPSLSINDLGNVGGYIDFIRFEEEPSLNLKDKGLAVGVGTLSLEKEVEKIKQQVDKEGGAILIDESQMVFKGFSATRLYYKPEDVNSNEERFIVIVNSGGKYTYSISTVPGQMAKIMEGFNFIHE